MYNYSLEFLLLMCVIAIIIQHHIITSQDEKIESLKARFNYIVWGDEDGKKWIPKSDN